MSIIFYAIHDQIILISIWNFFYYFINIFSILFLNNLDNYQNKKSVLMSFETFTKWMLNHHSRKLIFVSNYKNSLCTSHGSRCWPTASPRTRSGCGKKRSRMQRLGIRCTNILPNANLDPPRTCRKQLPQSPSQQKRNFSPGTVVWTGRRSRRGSTAFYACRCYAS